MQIRPTPALSVLSLFSLLPLVSCASAARNAYQEAAGPAAPSAQARESRIALILGGRSLDEDDYAPVEDQGVLGFEFAYEGVGSACGFEAGMQVSADEDDFGGADIEAITREIYGGIHKSLGTSNVRPYVGAGLTLVGVEIEVGGLSDDDASAALYAHGGLAIDVSESFFVGFDLRVLFGSDLEIGGVETDADYTQFGLLLGLRF